MSGDLAYSLDTLKAKGAQIFDPNFFGLYSFEYAYRLLLVYLSTNSTAIKGIRAEDPNAFDQVFKEDIASAIGYILSFHGIKANEETQSKLVDTANESLVLNIKTGMANAPQKVAALVAKSMDKLVMSSLDSNARSLIQRVFCEEN